MIVSMPLTKFRQSLSGLFLSQMITPVVLTVNDIPSKVIVDIPNSEADLELITHELVNLHHSLNSKKRRPSNE